MNQNCLVCNTKGPLPKNHIKDVFSDLNVLPSSRKLLDTLKEILDTPLMESNVHSKMICRKCYKTCIDYDGYKSKMNIIKMEMADEYSTNLQKLYPKQLPKLAKVKEEIPKGTIVVPASKLQPVPPDFQLNIGQLTSFGQLSNFGPLSNFGQVALSRANFVNKPSPQINLKVTIGSSVFTQSLNTSTVKIGKPIETIDMSNTIMTAKKDDINESIYNMNVNILPQDIFSTTNEDTNQNYEVDETGDQENGDADAEKGDGNEMEIDEDCALAVVPVTSQSQDITYDMGIVKTESSQTTNDTQYVNVNVLPSLDGSSSGSVVTADGNYMLSKFKIFNDENEDDDDDEQHTIVVDGENGSILEMMSGQKLIYENGELSLVMQDDDANENDEENDDDEAQDVSDSNDESQIELQVSGDEETANAIIAAAQEQGGAFIKVESGEMYRVKSVQSKPQDNFDISTFVIKEGNKFRCMLCHKIEESETTNKDLQDAATMMRHLKSAHDAKVYICQLCGAGMRRRLDYTKHIAEHSKKLAAQKGNLALKSKLHECDVCKKCYNSRTLLHEHMNTHTGTRPYKCHVCEKAFASKYTHQAHLKTHQNRPRPFKCRQCSKSFLSQQNLSQHEKTHSGVKNFVCSICHKAFGTQHNLEVHGVVHSGARPHACHRCGKGFARRAELKDHLRIHTGERPFECEVCGARFAQRSNLHSHRRATHLDDKRHHCPDCPKRFKRRRLLEYHIKATHTGERPLKCDVCHSTFVYPEHYKKHIRIHSGERPYFCEICGKSFNSRDNRNTHRFTHSDKKPYECLACGHSYMRKRLLIAHMNASGHLAESIVVNQPRVTRVHNTENGITTLVQVTDQSDLSQNSDDKTSEAVFHTSGKLELLTEDNNSSLTKMEGDEPGQQIFINNVVSDSLRTESSEETLIEAVSSTQLDTQTTQLATDENGAVLRLIPVKLSDGNDGWVAIND